MFDEAIVMGLDASNPIFAPVDNTLNNLISPAEIPQMLSSSDPFSELEPLVADFSDLTITSLTAPSSVVAGTSLSLTYTIANSGTVTANSSQTKFYLSTDSLIDAADAYLGYDSVSSMTAGLSRNESYAVVVNPNLAVGTYYLIAQIDGENVIAEGNEENNLFSQMLTVTKPDLGINSLSLPSSVVTGSAVRFNYTIANTGNASAKASTTRYYLSNDATYDAADVYLGDDAVPILAPGVSSIETDSLTFSNSLVAGNYYFLAVADSKQVVLESNENNNVLVQAVTITKPDLAINSTNLPTTIAAGSPINFNYAISNLGNASAKASTTRYYLSNDATYDAADTYLGDDTVSILAAGASSTESDSLTFSSSLAVGNYYFLAVADSKLGVAESNENNNVFAQAITITKPDLVINSTTLPTNVAFGSSISFTYTVTNQGNATAKLSTTKYYLSSDALLDSTDVLVGDDTINSLAAGASSIESDSVVLNVSSGSYYFLAIADASATVAESNDNNNLFSQAITINASGYSSTSGYGIINAAAAVAKIFNQNPYADVPNLGGNNWGADLIKAPEVWAQGYTGQNVIVAVIDTGVDYNHIDLSSNIWSNSDEIAGDGIDNDLNGYIDDVRGWDFAYGDNNPMDVDGHGTHVAGTIAGVNNNIGVTGIAYNAKIMPVKALDDSGSGSWSSVVSGIYYAVNNGAKVINMSLGGSSGNSTVQAAIQYASSQGVIVVSAAGNSSGATPLYPGSYASNWGLTVGAVAQNGSMASFSNKAGSNANMAYVMAPGVSIYSTVPNNSYAWYSGTSMATPHVAGVVALMLSANPTLTDAQVRSIVTSTASNILPLSVAAQAKSSLDFWLSADSLEQSDLVFKQPAGFL